MYLIGIGKGGSVIAKKIHEMATEHTLITFDEKDATYLTPKESQPEKVEEKFIPPDIDHLHDDICIFICGGGNTPFITLKLLEKWSDFNKTLVYVRPFKKNLSKTEETKEKVLFEVLKSYCLSGKFKLVVFDDNEITSKVGSSPVLSYYSKINQFISWIVLTYMIAKEDQPLLGKYNEPEQHSMITTLSVKRGKEGEYIDGSIIEHYRGKNFLFLVEKSALHEDETLLEYVESEVERWNSEYSSNSYVIYESYNDESLCIVETYTNNF